jgi:hypothetical protein
MADTEKIKAFFEAPFRPASGATAENRSATALEYIAYHIGEINRTLATIEKRLSEIDDHLTSLEQ